jgi:uncharacterized protein (TIGR03067 family)
MFVTLLLASLTVPADPPKEKEFSPETKKELKRFEGKWRLVKRLVNEGETEIKGRELTAVFKGAGIIFLSAGSDKQEMLEITSIDPGTDPKCIDLLEPQSNQSIEGVYKIDGETMQLAIAVPLGEKLRPVSFKKPKDPRIVVWTLQREKE